MRICHEKIRFRTTLPLYCRFDHLSTLLETVNRSDSSTQTYPPYNIELLEQDKYRISGSGRLTNEELDIQTEQRTLTVKGRQR